MKIIGQPSLFRRRVLSRIDVFGLAMRCLFVDLAFPPLPHYLCVSQAAVLRYRSSRQKSQGCSPIIPKKELSQALPRSPILEQPPSLFPIARPPSAPGLEGFCSAPAAGPAVSEPALTQGWCEHTSCRNSPAALESSGPPGLGLGST